MQPIHIPLTDKEMQTRVENLAKVADASLRDELENLGGFFALFGETQEALKVWEVADRLPPREDRYPSEHAQIAMRDCLDGDVQIAVRHCLDPNEPGLSAERVLEDRRFFTDEGEGFQARSRVTNVPPIAIDPGTPRGQLIEADRLARPLENGEFAPTELEALEIYKRLLAAPVVKEKDWSFDDFSIDHRCKAGPIAADIAARHGRRDEAIALLRQWHQTKIKNLKTARIFWYEQGPRTYGLGSVAALLCEGVLRDFSKFTAEQRAALITLIEARLAADPGSPFPLPMTEGWGLVLRTDFSDAAAWERVCEAIRDPEDEDFKNPQVDYVSDPYFDGKTAKEITPLALRLMSWHNHLFVVDKKTLTDRKNRVLVIDLDEEPGRTARVKPSDVATIFVQLSTMNASWEEMID